MQLLNSVEIIPDIIKYTVIWLHGLGADGHDFEPIVPELNFQNKIYTHFVFPHAPERNITINNGMYMRAWYDIVEVSIDAKQDIKGIRESAQRVAQLIEKEIECGIPSKNIILAGFSQGGAIALQLGLRYPEPLAGILALSSYLPLAQTLEAERHPANRPTSVFMAHGKFDPVIPIQLAEQSEQILSRLGYKLEWHEYPMEHSVIPDEINDISQWFTNILK